MQYQRLGTKDLLANLALVQNLTFSGDALNPLWSLPLEVQMYLLLPFAYFVVRRGRYRSIALWVLSLVLALVLPGVSGRLNMFTYAPCFMSGVLAFDLSRTAKRKLPGWTWPLFIVILIVLFGPFDNVGIQGKLYRAWVLSLAFGILIPHVHEVGGQWLHRVSHTIAEYSYGIYLSHEVVFWLAIYRMADWPISMRIGMLLVGSAAFPVAAYYAIEKPFIGYGARLASTFQSRPWRREPISVPLQVQPLVQTSVREGSTP
jgi:peptidoglycan/LPS O-acetylase OafA/YrhL